MIKYQMEEDQFLNHLKEYQPELVLLGDYLGEKSLTRFKCLRCGHVFDMRPRTVMYTFSNHCPNCGRGRRAVINTDTGVVYPSIAEASRQEDIPYYTLFKDVCFSAHFGNTKYRYI